MTISVCMPTYLGSDLIDSALRSVFAQTYQDFEVIVVNDSPSDHAAMEAAVKKYNDPRIRFFANEKNLGCALNVRHSAHFATREYIFMLSQDDVIIGNQVFERVMKVFADNPHVGAVTRPYYWFEDNIDIPVRATSRFFPGVLDIHHSDDDLLAVIRTVGQVSGLVYKRTLITHDFHHNVFPVHIYPFMSIMKTHKAYMYEDYMIAVRIATSQTRTISSTYSPSPTMSWCQMFEEVFPEAEHAHVRRKGIDIMAQNFVGLVQIRNYGYFKDYLIDIGYLIKYRPKNLLSWRFWLITLGTLLTPRVFLRAATDAYKRFYLSRRIKPLINSNPNTSQGIQPESHLAM